MILTERTCLRALEATDLSKRVEWLNNPMVRETLLIPFPR